MGTLQINILGTSFAIQAKEDSRYLEQLLSYYTQLSSEIEESAQLKDSIKISILSGIMLCDELHKERLKSAELKKLLNTSNETGNKSDDDYYEAERITLKMIQNIDRLLQ